MEACIIIAASFFFAIYVVSKIFCTRHKARGVDKATIFEALSLFVVMTSGSVAIAVLLILLAISQEEPIVYLSLVVGIMFFVQGVALFVVFFCKARTIELWGSVITCTYDDESIASASSKSTGGSSGKASSSGKSTDVVEL